MFRNVVKHCLSCLIYNFKFSEEDLETLLNSYITKRTKQRAFRAVIDFKNSKLVGQKKSMSAYTQLPQDEKMYNFLQYHSFEMNARCCSFDLI